MVHYLGINMTWIIIFVYLKLWIIFKYEISQVGVVILNWNKKNQVYIVHKNKLYVYSVKSNEEDE